MTESKFLVPAAIVVAGVMIAGAIYMGGNTSGRAPSRNTADSESIKIAPVTSKDHIRGAGTPSIVIVEYSDTECPFCKVFHNTMKQVLAEYPDEVAWVYRHFPIPQLHQKAIPEAIATECAAEQGGNAVFWKYLDQIFDATNSNDSLDLAELPKIALGLGLDVDSFNSCLSSGRYDELIQESMKSAVEAGAQGTPYSVILSDNGKTKTIINGAEPYESVKSKIDALLK